MKNKNPKALIGAGVAFIGAGVALNAAVNPGVGMGLMGIGIVFLIIGIKQKREGNDNEYGYGNRSFLKILSFALGQLSVHLAFGPSHPLCKNQFLCGSKEKQGKANR